MRSLLFVTLLAGELVGGCESPSPPDYGSLKRCRVDAGIKPGCLRTGEDCLTHESCYTGLCAGRVMGALHSGVCAPRSCLDGVKNGPETDVDCGGVECGPCAALKACMQAKDCMSGECVNQVCKAPPDCNDGLKNAKETDVDCGGGCQGCPDGKDCLQGGDCASLFCQNKLCAQRPTCSDGVKNGDETDVDCGGPTCSAQFKPCADTKKCRVGSDCDSLVCSTNSFTCQPNSCIDKVKNGFETDVDCGGRCQQKCEPGKMCKKHTDCASMTCLGLPDGGVAGIGTCK